jgi:hypothetical protein
MATASPREVQFDLRFMTSVDSQGGFRYLERSFLVVDGEPGVVA